MRDIDPGVLSQHPSLSHEYNEPLNEMSILDHLYSTPFISFDENAYHKPRGTSIFSRVYKEHFIFIRKHFELEVNSRQRLQRAIVSKLLELYMSSIRKFQFTL